MERRNKTIDIIKGIAILLVVITHFGWKENERNLLVFPTVIDMAVPAFMIISGYTYSLSYEKHGIAKNGDAYRWNNLRPKMVRYTVPFFVVILWEIIDPRINIKFPKSIDWLAWVLRGTDGAGSYYYPILIQLTMIFPIIYAAFARWGRRALPRMFLINAIYEIIRWAYGLNQESYRLLVFRYIFLIAAGAYAYKGYKMKKMSNVLITVLGLAYILVINRTSYEPYILNFWTSTNFLSVMLIVPLMIWILQNVHLKTKFFAPIEEIGKASYHIFLVQMVYYLGYYHIVEEITHSRKELLAASVLLSIAIGWVFYKTETFITKRVSSL